MNTKKAFETWAEDHAFVFERSTLPKRTYVYFNTENAWRAYQAATSRQEAKIKALVDALESFTKSDYIKKQHPVRYKNAVAALAASKEIP